MIYLDNAATTLYKPASVRKAMLNAFDSFTNAGRGGYKAAMGAADCVFTARERAAELFGADRPEQIVFTHNATHALNMAIKGLASPGECVISGYEHNSVLRPLTSLKAYGVTARVARGRLFDSEEMVKKFKEEINRNTSFAVCTHMSNAFGYILPIKEIDDVCYKAGIPLIIDASQSAGSIDIKLSLLRATEAICAPGHKGLYGPQGTGVLVCRNGAGLKTIIEGGTGSVSAEDAQPDFMPDRLESGTQNIPGIAGLSEGIKYVLDKGTDRILKHSRILTELASYELSKIPGIRVFSSDEREAQGGVLSFSADNISSERVAAYLAENNISVRGGLHCAPLAHETVGTKGGTVRISVSSFTREKDISVFIYYVKKLMLAEN